MKKIFYFLLVGLVPFLASCEKETTYTINKSGSLTIKVVDSDDNGIDNAKIDLRLSGETLFYDSTDVSGVYKSEEMLEGIYRCYVSATRNGLVYNSNQYVQVIAGQNKHVEINPFGDSKKISVGLSNYYNDTPILANVLICPWVNASLDEYKELAYFSGKTTNGQFSVDEIPYGSYHVVFYDDNDKILETIEIYVSKDSQSEYKSYVYVSTVTVKLVNYYNDAPFTTPYNVLIVPGWGWGNSLDEYKEQAVAKGKTNAGTVVFENIASPYENYHYQIIFYDDNNNIVKDEGAYVEEGNPVFEFYMYASTVTVKLVNYYNDAPIATPYNVLIVPGWGWGNSLDENKQQAVAKGKTNAGAVVFENIVSPYENYHYQIIFYDDNNNIVMNEGVYVEDDDPEFKFYMYISTVTVKFVNYYNDAPLASLNVLLARDWMNSLDEYKESAVAKGKTNDQGSVVFENLVSFYNGYSYHVIAYNDDDQVQVDDYIYISQASESFTLGVWWWDY